MIVELLMGLAVLYCQLSLQLGRRTALLHSHPHPLHRPNFLLYFLQIDSRSAGSNLYDTGHSAWRSDKHALPPVQASYHQTGLFRKNRAYMQQSKNSLDSLAFDWRAKGEFRFYGVSNWLAEE